MRICPGLISFGPYGATSIGLTPASVQIVSLRWVILVRPLRDFGETTFVQPSSRRASSDNP